MPANATQQTRRSSMGLRIQLFTLVLSIVSLCGGLSFYIMTQYSAPMDEYQVIINKTAQANDLLGNTREIVNHDLYYTISNLKDTPTKKRFLDKISDLRIATNTLKAHAITAEEERKLQSLNRIFESFISACIDATDHKNNTKAHLEAYERATTIFGILEKNLAEFIQLEVSYMEQVSARLQKTTHQLWLVMIGIITTVLLLCSGASLFYVNRLSKSIHQELEDSAEAATLAWNSAIRDSLTGLHNRLFIEDFIQEHMDAHEAPPFTLIIVDLDNFKHINDTYGHDVGDQLLKVIAGRLQQSVRAGDQVARLGGDEFIAMLITDDAQLIKTSVVRFVKTLSTPVQCGELTLSISASVGAASFPHDGTSYKELFVKADLAMFDIKKTGKNGFKLVS